MTIYEGMTLGLAGLAIIVSVLSFLRSNAVAHGMIELEVSGMISKSQERVEDLSIQMNPLLSVAEKSEEQKKQLEVLVRVFKSAVENNINAYEQACAKYLDGKIDRKRFKKTYQRSLRQIVQNPQHESHFKEPTSTYYAILKVYKEWENTEQ
jgi:hypothetical protein